MMKYIRTKNGSFYTSPRGIPHTGFAQDNHIAKENIMSAGFIVNGKCCDRSVSLNIAAGANDTADLRKQMGMETMK